MSQPQRTMYMLLAATVIASSAVAQGTPAATIAAFHEALARGDSTAALELLTLDVLIYESGGVEQSRAEYQSHHLAADMAFAGSTTRDVIAQNTNESGDIAWATATSTTVGTFRDREVNMRGTETMVLRRTPEGWRIVHIHWSSRQQ